MADFSALDPCVHCGFCLPACPTYQVTGDESDSPRGRIVLMRALERGEIGADDPALVQHLDACLGCRGCEPVCPSGVGYGRGLEAARELLVERRGLPVLARAVLGVFRRPLLWRTLFGGSRVMRDLGLTSLGRRHSQAGFALGMLGATRPNPRSAARSKASGTGAMTPAGPTVALFRGCVMDALFDHVHDATRRTLAANGYRVIEIQGQGCCGALHDHAGDTAGARDLARQNVAGFAERADFVTTNSAGCGALLKDYGHLLGDPAAERFASRVRDVTELLAAEGPRPGGALHLTVAYDAPCHLAHAQGVHQPPLAVLGAIPGLTLQVLPDSDRCCGSAGIFSILQPEMSRAVLEVKLASLAAARPRPDLVATGNPGCLMQLGAGLRSAGLGIGVVHPVEPLDWSYREAGLYG